MKPVSKTLGALALVACACAGDDQVVLAPGVHRLVLGAEAPAMHWIGGEGRSCVGLAAGGFLEGALEAAPGAPAVLSFAHALSGPPGSEAELSVQFLGSDGSIVFEAPDIGVGGRWQQSAIDLPDEALTRVLRIRFALASAGEVTAHLAEAMVTVRGDERPSVLLVTTDTHRGDHLGIAGGDVVTPHLDRLAREGAYFAHCFAVANVTIPAHVALMTGRHPRDTGVLGNRDRLHPDAPTLAEAFAARGYRTWAVLGAEHLLGHHSGLDQGFDRMEGPQAGQREAGLSVGQLLKWSAWRSDGPLFVWLHVFDAHWPYEVSEDLAPPDSARTENVDFDAILELPDAARRALLLEAGGLGRLRALYRAEVAYVDRQIGRLLEDARFADALVAVVADHGESLGEHDIYFEHTGLYRQSLHVPLLFHGRGVPALGPVRRMVSQADVGRTLLDLAGFEDASFPGTPLLVEPDPAAAPGPFFALHSAGLAASVTHRGKHLILQLADYQSNMETVRRERHEVKLFDLDRDPECAHDLAPTEPDLTRAMRALLIRWLEQREDLRWAGAQSIAPAMEAQLEALGYAEEPTPTGARLWLEDGCERCRPFE